VTVHVVTDSTSDLTPQMAAQLGVTVVPLRVRFGEETYLDGVDIDAATFYSRLPGAVPLPVTSQPPPSDFAAAYERLLTHPGDQVASIHLSAKWSGTLQSAHLAAQDFAGRVAVVDSQTVSAGIQFLVRAALRDIAAGQDLDSIVRNAEARRGRIAIYVMLDTLTYLQKGGRIGRAQALLGGVLSVKPLLRLADGEAHPQARVRNRQQGVAKLLELLSGEGPLESVALMTSGAAQPSDDVRTRLYEAYPELELQAGELGPVVGVYAGPGAVGVGGLRAG
jgi:DegV family protein with EDD domain